jgi:hypothetical protein
LSPANVLKQGIFYSEIAKLGQEIEEILKKAAR